MRYAHWFLTTCLALPAVAAEVPGGRVETAHFTFREVREGIFHAVGKPSVSAGSNAALIVGADHLLIVDSHMTPAAARALLADLPAVTDKPVRYVINTHFHFDHVHGSPPHGSGRSPQRFGIGPRQPRDRLPPAGQ